MLAYGREWGCEVDDTHRIQEHADLVPVTSGKAVVLPSVVGAEVRRSLRAHHDMTDEGGVDAITNCATRMAEGEERSEGGVRNNEVCEVRVHVEREGGGRRGGG